MRCTSRASCSCYITRTKISWGTRLYIQRQWNLVIDGTIACENSGNTFVSAQLPNNNIKGTIYRSTWLYFGRLRTKHASLFPNMLRTLLDVKVTFRYSLGPCQVYLEVGGLWGLWFLGCRRFFSRRRVLCRRRCRCHSSRPQNWWPGRFVGDAWWEPLSRSPAKSHFFRMKNDAP